MEDDAANTLLRMSSSSSPPSSPPQQQPQQPQQQQQQPQKETLNPPEPRDGERQPPPDAQTIRDGVLAEGAGGGQLLTTFFRTRRDLFIRWMNVRGDKYIAQGCANQSKLPVKTFIRPRSLLYSNYTTRSRRARDQFPRTGVRFKPCACATFEGEPIGRTSCKKGMASVYPGVTPITKVEAGTTYHTTLEDKNGGVFCFCTRFAAKDHNVCSACMTDSTGSRGAAAGAPKQKKRPRAATSEDGRLKVVQRRDSLCTHGAAAERELSFGAAAFDLLGPLEGLLEDEDADASLRALALQPFWDKPNPEEEAYDGLRLSDDSWSSYPLTGKGAVNGVLEGDERGEGGSLEGQVERGWAGQRAKRQRAATAVAASGTGVGAGPGRPIGRDAVLTRERMAGAAAAVPAAGAEAGAEAGARAPKRRRPGPRGLPPSGAAPPATAYPSRTYTSAPSAPANAADPEPPSLVLDAFPPAEAAPATASADFLGSLFAEFRSAVFAQGDHGAPSLLLDAQPDLASLQQVLNASSAEARSALEEKIRADDDFNRLGTLASELSAKLSEALESMRKSGMRREQAHDKAHRTTKAEGEARHRLETAVNVMDAVHRLQAGVQAGVNQAQL